MTLDQVKIFTDAFESRFDADIDYEEVAPGRFRFAVSSPQFEGMHHLDRQDLIWDVVDEVGSRDAIFDISIILAYAPSELEAAA